MAIDMSNNPNGWTLVRNGKYEGVIKDIYSLDEFQSYLKASKRTIPSMKSSQDSNDDWAGGSYSEAERMLVDGWPEGREKMAKGLSDLSNIHHAPRRYWDHDVGGAFPDVQRYISGDPMAMRKPAQKRVPAVRVLHMQNTVSAMVDARTVTTWGIAIASLIDKLESEGTRVEFWITGPSDMNGDDFFAYRILVKPADQHMDQDKLAFMGHVAFFRRLCFRLIETLPKDAASRVTNSYGRPMDVLVLPAAKRDMFLPPGATFVPGPNASGAGGDVVKAVAQLEPFFRDETAVNS